MKCVAKGAGKIGAFLLALQQRAAFGVQGNHEAAEAATFLPPTATSPDCFFCGHPLKVASATTLVCVACRMAEFVSADETAAAEERRAEGIGHLSWPPHTFLEPALCFLKRVFNAAARKGALRQGLRDIGYLVRENVAVEYRWAENQLDRLPLR